MAIFKIDPKSKLPRFSAILIYSFLAILAYVFFKTHSLENQDKTQYLVIYIPYSIAALYIFIAGVNWSAGMYSERLNLMLYSVLQYCYLVYFGFFIKPSAEGFSTLEYYRRAIYFIPVIIVQILIDKYLRKDGTFTHWFYKQKLIANSFLILACAWNYYAFDYYFNLEKSGLK